MEKGLDPPSEEKLATERSRLASGGENKQAFG
jgi:hypothetical protein